MCRDAIVTLMKTDGVSTTWPVKEPRVMMKGKPRDLKIASALTLTRSLQIQLAALSLYRIISRYCEFSGLRCFVAVVDARWTSRQLADKEARFRLGARQDARP